MSAVFAPQEDSGRMHPLSGLENYRPDIDLYQSETKSPPHGKGYLTALIGLNVYDWHRVGHVYDP